MKRFIIMLLAVLTIFGGAEYTVFAKETTKAMVIEDGILVSYTGTDTKLVIPKSVTKIGPSAFAGNTTLEYVSGGVNVKEIGEKAFYNCTALINVSIEGH